VRFERSRFSRCRIFDAVGIGIALRAHCQFSIRTDFLKHRMSEGGECNAHAWRIARDIIAGERQQIGAMKAALGQPLSETTSSTASSGQSSQIGSRSAHNAAR
jgi:hypothetical protein